MQPWGRDGDKRRYWLIEGQDDTDFRVYRESNPVLKSATWWSVAGSIEELRLLATKLQEEDGSRDAKALGERMLHAIPRFEATEEVLKTVYTWLDYCSLSNRNASVASTALPARPPFPALNLVSLCTKAERAVSE